MRCMQSLFFIDVITETHMAFTIIQIILAVLLIVLVLIQGKGSGLGAAFGGSSNVYRTKRGAEKMLHYGTIIVSVAFFGISFAMFIV